MYLDGFFTVGILPDSDEAGGLKVARGAEILAGQMLPHEYDRPQFGAKNR
jgi:hypothetical protein